MNDGTSLRVLIVLLGSLGDISRALIVMPALRKKFPQIRVTWVVHSAFPSLFHGIAQGPDRIISFDRSRGIRGFFNCVREIRCEKYDVVFDMQRILKSGLLSALSGGSRRIGFHRKNSKEFNWIFQTEHIRPVDERTTSKISQYMDFARLLCGSEPDFVFPTLTAKTRMNPRPCLGVILGSSWKSKDWPLSGYIAVVRQLCLNIPSLEVRLLGTNEQIDFGKKIQAGIPEHAANIQNFAGRTSLSQLLDHISQCQVLVGPDSGPGHMAALLGVPVVVLYGATDPQRVSPWGSEYLAVQSAAGCSPCGSRVCPGLDTFCMKILPTTLICDRLQPYLQAASPVGAATSSNSC